MQADYRETLAHVASLGGADLVATSPPYCDARTYGAGVSWTDADYAALGDAVFAALKPGGHALINVDAPVREWRKGYGTERGFHPWRMMLDWAERVGFRVPDRLAFGRKGLPGDTPGRFQCGWEPLLWFQRPGGETWLDKRAIATKALGVGGGGHNRRSRSGGIVKMDRKPVEVELPDTLWDYGQVGSAGAPDIEAENHPARWPYKLAEDIVRCFCPPDGLAVDPFVGAGTSAVAALEHGRRFHGGDLGVRTADPERGLDAVPWVVVTERVIDRRFRQQRLFGGAR
jgi:site-specific DNA-methyltransferase (adenine-specific)